MAPSVVSDDIEEEASLILESPMPCKTLAIDSFHQLQDFIVDIDGIQAHGKSLLIRFSCILSSS